MDHQQSSGTCNRRIFYTELAYVLGMLILTFGTALIERSDFGLSMIVAPAYILHLKVSQYLPFFSFGMAEYAFQLILIILLSLVLRKFKISYLFSFVTAVLYGFTLDANILLVSLIPGGNTFWSRCLFYACGLLLSTVGVAFFFHTYFAPEAYELVVKELTETSGKPLYLVKYVYDMSSLVLSILLSFCFFGFMKFEGISGGTILTAFLNGPLIGLFSEWMIKHFEFADKFQWRSFFEK